MTCYYAHMQKHVLTTAEDMICALADSCNHAQTHDGQGFSRFDADLGHSLANVAASGKPWTQAQATAAITLIKKYQKQLHGTDMQLWLQDPKFKQQPCSKNLGNEPRKLTSSDKHAVFQFPYDLSVIDAVKTIRGLHRGNKYWASWNASSRTWQVPVNESSIFQIMQAAEKFNFEIEDRFRQYLAKVEEKLQESKTMLMLNGNRNVVMTGDTVLINVSDLAVLEEMQRELREFIYV